MSSVFCYLILLEGKEIPSACPLDILNLVSPPPPSLKLYHIIQLPETLKTLPLSSIAESSLTSLSMVSDPLGDPPSVVTSFPVQTTDSFSPSSLGSFGIPVGGGNSVSGAVDMFGFSTNVSHRPLYVTLSPSLPPLSLPPSLLSLSLPPSSLSLFLPPLSLFLPPPLSLPPLS